MRKRVQARDEETEFAHHGDKVVHAAANTPASAACEVSKTRSPQQPKAPALAQAEALSQLLVIHVREEGVAGRDPVIAVLVGLLRAELRHLHMALREILVVSFARADPRQTDSTNHARKKNAKYGSDPPYHQRARYHIQARAQSCTGRSSAVREANGGAATANSL